ncbi:MAG: type III secretion system outer membrane ring subunit SctC [Lysobacteraceae bacterium]
MDRGIHAGLRALIAYTVLGTVLLALGAPARGAEIPFRPGTVEFDLRQEPIQEFLVRFFTEQDLSVVLSEELEELEITLSGPRRGTRREVFRSVANTAQVIGYYDGNAVYLYRSRERETRDFALSPAAVERFIRGFLELRLGDEFNTFTASAETGIVMVSGTPRFIEQVSVLARNLSMTSASGQLAFRHIPLRYAWASDTNIHVGNREVTVPGVANILRQLMGLGGPDTIAQGRRETSQRMSAQRLRGQGLASIADTARGPAFAEPMARAMRLDPGEHDEEVIDLPPPPQAAPGGIAQVVADPYRNAIIIQDHPERLPMYETLIEALDVEPRIVEIEATIIDVDVAKLRNLGVNWRWQNSRYEAVFGPEGAKNDFLRALLGNAGQGNIDLLRPLPGLSLGGIIGDSGRFIARVNLLEDEGVTHVVSRPQIVTLNDVEAVIENSQTLYVPVQGSFEVDLFNVVAGTILRVTPHVIEGELADDPSQIRMVVAVEDGGLRFESGRIQNTDLPVVTRSAVNTQAIIREGESLLVGGLVQDASRNRVDQVPGLGNVPVIGALFRSVERERARTERLFLITPRLVTANRITGQQAPSSPDVDVEQLDAIQEAARPRWRARRG